MEDLLQGVRLSPPTVVQDLVATQVSLASMDDHHVLPEAHLDLYRPLPEDTYWQRRGFTEDEISQWRLGYDYVSDRATYPARRPDGALLGVVGRAVHPDQQPKYLYPRGFLKSENLFGYSSWLHSGDTRVVLVEGAVDAMGLWQVGVTAMAIYGSKMSQAQVDLLVRGGAEDVVLAFDADPAGWQARDRVLLSSLPFHARVWNAQWPSEWGKDIQELTPERRLHVVGHAERQEIA